MISVILGIVAMTLGTILAMFIFALGSITNKLSTQEKFWFYVSSLAIYVGGCYAVISNVGTGT